mgnify:CR=1 FL=1
MTSLAFRSFGMAIAFYDSHVCRVNRRWVVRGRGPLFLSSLLSTRFVPKTFNEQGRQMVGAVASSALWGKWA